ncbi:MAG: VWA domain-containing protein [Anaerolineales bacterium]
MNNRSQMWLIVGGAVLALLCLCSVGVFLVGRAFFTIDQNAIISGGDDANSTAAELTIAVSPGMAPTFNRLVAQFNAQTRETPDGTPMSIRTVTMAPEKMVAESLGRPPFQAIAPDSSLWLNQLDRRWTEAQSESQAVEETIIPIGNRRFDNPIRYATSPVVIAAWEEVARDLGWPDQAVGWEDIQRQATANPNFKWNHPSTAHASGLLATLAEFYAGAGLTRGLTPEDATAESTLDYVRNVEATVRFYGEGEDVIVQRLAEEGRNFLDAFVTQEQVVIAWNQNYPGDRLVALYPAEGTLWADHPLALLELGASGEMPVSDNQRRTYQAFTSYLMTQEVQKQLLDAGYRPADLDISLEGAGSPFEASDAVDWRQPQTTLQIPSAEVVEVVQNVWWYTKRPTNVYLVVDTSGSMGGEKISRTQEALQSFVEQMRGDRDKIGLISFSTAVQELRSLQALDDAGRNELRTAIADLQATGETALIDGVWEAYTRLQAVGDAEAINAIVVMTDGHENHSQQSLAELRRRWESDEGQGVPIVIFTIAFGDHADEKLLQRMAEIGEGQFRRADETDIEELYKIISTYF